MIERLEKVMRWWRRRHTTCCTMPIPRTDAQGGAMREAWETATGLSRTVSLMGTADEILAQHNRDYVDWFGVDVFPQLTVLDMDGAVDVAREYQPKWLSLLVEANDPKHGYVDTAYLDLIQRGVRHVSPRTKCCVSNQYEMRGKYPPVTWINADACAATTYPEFSIGQNPLSDLYYKSMTGLWGRPLIIAECGATNLALQLAMAKALLRLKPNLLNYYFTFDLPYWPDQRFARMGLKDETRRELFA